MFTREDSYMRHLPQKMFRCNIGIMDDTDETWQSIGIETIEGRLVTLIDGCFGGGEFNDISYIEKTKYSLFDATSYTSSCIVYLVRYRDNGETNIMSHSRRILELIQWMNGVREEIEEIEYSDIINRIKRKK